MRFFINNIGECIVRWRKDLEDLFVTDNVRRHLKRDCIVDDSRGAVDSGN